MFRLKPEVVVETVDNEGIIVDPSTGRYISLNGTAVEMITVLVKSSDVATAVDSLTKTMATDCGTIERDVASLTSQLHDLGLVEDGAPEG